MQKYLMEVCKNEGAILFSVVSSQDQQKSMLFFHLLPDSKVEGTGFIAVQTSLMSGQLNSTTHSITVQWEGMRHLEEILIWPENWGVAWGMKTSM